MDISEKNFEAAIESVLVGIAPTGLPGDPDLVYLATHPAGVRTVFRASAK